MKLSTQTVFALADALNSLNGYSETVNDGDRATVKQTPYNFKPEVRWAIAKNLAKLNAVLDAYHKTRQGMILQITGGASVEIKQPPAGDKDKPDYAERMARYDKQMAEGTRINTLFMNELHDLDLLPLTEAQLELKINPVPLNTLAAMAPLMEGPGWDKPNVTFATQPVMTVGHVPLANGAVAPAAAQ